MSIEIEPIDVKLSVCKVADYSQIDISQPFCFTGATDEELSLVCPTDLVPGNTTERDDGWRAFRIAGTLDFALIGILVGIAKVLAANEIGIFAVSTYNTDYILTKEENYEKALNVLRGAGYSIKGKDESIEALIASSEICILQFGDESCGPCFALRERIEKWLETHPEAEGRYVAIRENMEVSAQMGILSVPTVAVYVCGKEIARESGCFSLDHILERADRYAEMLK